MNSKALACAQQVMGRERFYWASVCVWAKIWVCVWQHVMLRCKLGQFHDYGLYWGTRFFTMRIVLNLGYRYHYAFTEDVMLNFLARSESNTITGTCISFACASAISFTCACSIRLIASRRLSTSCTWVGELLEWARLRAERQVSAHSMTSKTTCWIEGQRSFRMPCKTSSSSP